ncbi:transmembrane amino acid transporter [Colletotrichum tofieldiae]|nr:transmembrane amino acid transporter [Colletotrichum tofieldiae]
MDKDLRQPETAPSDKGAAELAFSRTDAETGGLTGFSAWFGGRKTKVGPRIAPRQEGVGEHSDSEESPMRSWESSSQKRTGMPSSIGRAVGKR